MEVHSDRGYDVFKEEEERSSKHSLRWTSFLCFFCCCSRNRKHIVRFRKRTVQAHSATVGDITTPEGKFRDAAVKIQSIYRGFIGRQVAKGQWKAAMKDAQDYWDDVQRLRNLERDRLRALKEARDLFIQRVVKYSIDQGLFQFLVRSRASILIQKSWRGLLTRRSTKRFIPKRKKKSPPTKKRPFSLDVYRRIWARMIFEPALENGSGGWPGRADLKDFDLWDHIDSPPAGRRHGLITRKIPAAPRSEKDKLILTRDKNSWVGVPVSVSLKSEYHNTTSDGITSGASAHIKSPILDRLLSPTHPYTQSMLRGVASSVHSDDDNSDVTFKSFRSGPMRRLLLRWKEEDENTVAKYRMRDSQYDSDGRLIQRSPTRPPKLNAMFYDPGLRQLADTFFQGEVAAFTQQSGEHDNGIMVATYYGHSNGGDDNYDNYGNLLSGREGGSVSKSLGQMSSAAMASTAAIDLKLTQLSSSRHTRESSISQSRDVNLVATGLMSSDQLIAENGTNGSSVSRPGTSGDMMRATKRFSDFYVQPYNMNQSRGDTSRMKEGDSKRGSTAPESRPWNSKIDNGPTRILLTTLRPTTMTPEFKVRANIEIAHLIHSDIDIEGQNGVKKKELDRLRRMYIGPEEAFKVERNVTYDDKFLVPTAETDADEKDGGIFGNGDNNNTKYNNDNHPLEVAEWGEQDPELANDFNDSTIAALWKKNNRRRSSTKDDRSGGYANIIGTLSRPVKIGRGVGSGLTTTRASRIWPASTEITNNNNNNAGGTNTTMSVSGISGLHRTNFNNNHTKTRYTWVPQPLLHNAARQLYYPNNHGEANS